VSHVTRLGASPRGGADSDDSDSPAANRAPSPAPTLRHRRAYTRRESSDHSDHSDSGSRASPNPESRRHGSGPRAGFAELIIPANEPGSSIMPGKVNPVMSEMLIQVCLYTQGLAQTVALSGRDGQLELNVTLPLMAHAMHEAVHCLANGTRVFADACVAGIEADEARCRELMERSLMLVTALNPFWRFASASP
jgi:hypothetical protein